MVEFAGQRRPRTKTSNTKQAQWSVDSTETDGVTHRQALDRRRVQTSSGRRRHALMLNEGRGGNMDHVFFGTTGEVGQRIGFWSFARAALAIGAIACVASVSEARITRLQIVSVQSPTFGALSFCSVGQYEKIFAIAYG